MINGRFLYKLFKNIKAFTPQQTKIRGYSHFALAGKSTKSYAGGGFGGRIWIV
jgi:hypothetical protein